MLLRMAVRCNGGGKLQGVVSGVEFESIIIAEEV
jgi:hypothetical protein